MASTPVKSFTQIPDEVIFHPELSPSTFRLYVNLLHYGRQVGVCWPSHKRLAKGTGFSIGYVRKLLNELEQKNFIIIERRARYGTSNRYHLLIAVGDTKATEVSVPQVSPKVPRKKVQIKKYEGLV